MPSRMATVIAMPRRDSVGILDLNPDMASERVYLSAEL